MELLLWRNAEAEKAAAGVADQARLLTGHGRKQAEKMAAWIKARLPEKTAIFVAPALRTRQTADYLGLEYAIERRLGVGADTADLLSVAQWPEGRKTTLLICHQHSIGRLVSLFVGGAEQEGTPIKKCGVFWFSSRERELRLQVVMRAALYPDLL